MSGPDVPPSAESPEQALTEPVKVTDRRRIDPVTGAVRAPAADRTTAPSTGPGPAVAVDGPTGPNGSDSDQTERRVAELTADLQRVQAEYANYRKRVERDRDLVRSQSTAAVLAELLPVLDDIGRAREHDELDGAFKAVGEALEGTVTRLGLERFGQVGEVFDPSVHEALTHEHRDDVDQPVCIAVYQPGYRYAGRVLRPARVGVAEPDQE